MQVSIPQQQHSHIHIHQMAATILIDALVLLHRLLHHCLHRQQLHLHVVDDCHIRANTTQLQMRRVLRHHKRQAFVTELHLQITSRRSAIPSNRAQHRQRTNNLLQQQQSSFPIQT